MLISRKTLKRLILAIMICNKKKLDLSAKMHLRETQRGVKCIKKIFKNNNYISIDDGINYYDKNISENDNEIDNNNEIDDDYTSSGRSSTCF